MSRTLRRLPVGSWKKHGKIGHYNPTTPRFAPSDIHVLRKPMKPQSHGRFLRRYGIYLHAPGAGSYWTRVRYDYYGPDELRPSKNSIAGPRWVEASEFSLDHPLILKGWTYSHHYETVQVGPEDWNCTYKDLGPQFSWSRLWLDNPDFDAELEDAFYNWRRVHMFVCRNGHYKDRHPGRAWRRRSKQKDHQIERRRLKHQLQRIDLED